MESPNGITFFFPLNFQYTEKFKDKLSEMLRYYAQGQDFKYLEISIYYNFANFDLIILPKFNINIIGF